MLESRIALLWACSALLALATAGPLHRYPRETEDDQNMDLSAYANYTANEVCFSDNEVFQRGALMPNPGPCEECRCEPPSIVCHMIKCPVNNNGCRTIQRPNHCCPDYNCECDYNGQLYNDGERIDLPEEPCQVCYCKGGDVMCTSITCYQRDDCEPIHVPGQCCPKYDNCPLRDQASSSGDDKSVRTRSPNHSPKREMQPWLLTKSVLQTSSLPVLKTSEDLTTEDNIVIVSDWLSERRSTTDDSGYQTLGPVVVTDSQNPTSKRHTISTINPDGSIVRQSETITPLDEVIFTRVDMLRGNPEQRHESQTVPPFTASIVTHSPLNSNEPSKETATVRDATPSSNSTHSSADGNLNSTVPGMKINSIVWIDEEKETSTITSTEPSFNLKSVGMNDKSRIKIDGSQHEHTESPDEMYTTSDYFTRPKDDNDSLSEVALINDSIVTSNNEGNKSNVELDAETKLDDKDKLNIGEPAEFTLDHFFGFDKVYEEEVSLDTTSFETSTFGNTEKHLDNIQNTNDLNAGSEDTTGYLETSTVQDDVVEHSSNEASEIPSAKMFKDESDDSSMISTEGENNNPKDITAINSEEVESTTAYITEDHMSELNLKSSEFIEGSHLMENAKNLEEKTDFEVTTLEATETPLNGDVFKGKIVQINISNVTLNDNSYADTTTEVLEMEEIPQSTSGQEVSSEVPIVQNSLEAKHEAHIEAINGEGNVPNDESITEKQSTLHNQFVGTITDITFRETIDEQTEENRDKNNLPSIQEPQPRESSEDFTVIRTNEEILNEPKEVISNPPILELNSHVPFLQIGGHFSSDSYSAVNEESQNAQEKKAKLRNELLENSEKDPVQVETETTLQPFPDITNPDESNSDESSEKHEPITSYKSEVDTTSHIPLTPGDLKVIAEYMINERIKPANQKNNSTYLENQWLKGNLTSEEKMASILSAANITIGIINRTSSEAKSVWPETSTKTNEILKVEKFEKEQLFKGNSILDGKSAVTKYSKTQDQSKSYSKAEKHGDSVTPPDNLSSNISMDANNEQDSSTSGYYNRKDSTENIFMGKILVPQNNLTEATFLINSPRSPTEDVNKTTVTEEKEDHSRTQRVLSSSSEETDSDDITSDSARFQDTPVHHKEAP
ncbi:uncharacterized protein LOC124367564 [Homalodisca vitripennis]|uniref:uncharacterized protein LOC124367564 n=1 Tax=Homalodisca vitripennis TaxID=197043 RepID=UPI001EEBE7D7|nr:uncharacterized protein LOC124367564 [Homalodisca vitripennis]XP_046680453.1 uncharacterized protein LOC124367564 [Homalodisca vitripennis]